MREITHKHAGWRDSSVMEKAGVYCKSAHTFWSSNRRGEIKYCHWDDNKILSSALQWESRGGTVWSARLTAECEKNFEVRIEER